MQTRAVIKFLFLQGKEPKEIRAILPESLARFLPGRAKDLSYPLYLKFEKKNLQASHVRNIGFLCYIFLKREAC